MHQNAVEPGAKKIMVISQPGARPTEDISIEFEIRPKLGAL